MPLLNDLLSDELGLSIGSIEEFTPFTLDVTPLQKAFATLSKQIEQCQKENAGLRAELQELKVARRLEALEQGLQELADSARPAMGFFGAPVASAGSMGGNYSYEDAMAAGAVNGDGTVDQVFAAAHPMLAAQIKAGSLQGPASKAPPGSAGSLQGPSSMGSAAPASAVGSLPPSAVGMSAAAAGAAMPSAANVSSWATFGAGAAGVGPSAPGNAGVSPTAGMNPAAMASYAKMMAASGNPAAAAGSAPSMASMAAGGGDASWMLYEMAQIKERLTAMERKSEALWHVREGEEDLRVAVERLRQDVQGVQGRAVEMQALVTNTTQVMDRANQQADATVQMLKDLQDKVHMNELALGKSNDDRREMGLKQENTVSQIWDQLRHVESSLAQRLTLAETSHVAAMQEVDEAKEGTSEVLQRVEDIKRHVSGLEAKLEGFSQAMVQAITPIHSTLSSHLERLEALQRTKQDAASAVLFKDVETAVARAADHAERRADNIIKAIAGVEKRIEALAEETPHKSEVVMTADLEALLTEHAHELDNHLDKLKADLMSVLEVKVDREELLSLDGRMGSRVAGLEGAILKGLKAISDKVSAALAEKLDLARFSEFKLQVRAILADVEDRLRDWSPAAIGVKASMAADGSTGASTCLLCDTRVRAARDLRAMGFNEADRVFSPEKLPAPDGLFPSITVSRNPVLGARNNARVVGKLVDKSERIRGGTTQSIMMESIPAPRPGSPSVMAPGAMGLNSLDPTSQITLPSPSKGSIPAKHQKAMKVEVETISGGIAKGQVPASRSGQRQAAGSGMAAAVAAASSSASPLPHAGLPPQTPDPVMQVAESPRMADALVVQGTVAVVATATGSGVTTPLTHQHSRLTGWEPGAMSPTHETGPVEAQS